MFGGFTGKEKLNDVHEYNPATKMWKELETNNPPSARYLHTAVSYKEDVYILGGTQSNAGSEDHSLHILNLPTLTWSKVPQHPNLTTKSGHAAVASHRRMWVLGGYPVGGAHTNTLTSYFFETGVWEDKASLPVNASFHSFFAHGDKLYAFGGFDGTSYSNTLYCYSINNDVWSVIEMKGDVPSPRCGHSCVAYMDEV